MKKTRPRIISEEDMSSLEGFHLGDEYISEIIDSDIDLYDEETGELIVSLRKNILIHSDLALNHLGKMVATARGRSASAGQIDPNSKYMKKRELVNTKGISTSYMVKGKPSKMKINNPVESSPLGYYESTRKLGLNLPCRLTSFTKNHLSDFEAGIPYINELSNYYKYLAPTQYNNQKDRINQSEKYKIGDSVFSTITINRNFRTALHKDKGDFGGYAVLSVCEYGSYNGGLFMLPEYGLGINLRQDDIMVAKVHLYHCNSELWTTPEQDEYNKKIPPRFRVNPEVGIMGSEYNFSRFSFVSYLRDKMKDCDNE